jgi:hypothetical protein
VSAVVNPFTGKIDFTGTPPDLSGYALLDGTNQPFTGNVTISKANPKLIATDTGLASSIWLERDTTFDGGRLVSQNRLYTLPNALTLAGATYGSGLSYTSTGALSVSFWWKTSSAGDSYFIGDSDASSDFRWGSSILSFQDEAAGLARYWTAGAFADNTWRHICLTISSDRATVKAYINGVAATQTQAGTVGGNFVITRIFATNGNLNGSMDDFRILTTELSAADVLAIYNARQETTDMTNMYAYYKLNETSGTSVADSSGNARTVTLVGGTPVWATGTVASTVAALSDIPVLRMANNTTGNSYGTATLGYYSASNGTSNVYEGLSHQWNTLGTARGELTTARTVFGNAVSSVLSGAVVFGRDNTQTAGVAGSYRGVIFGWSNADAKGGQVLLGIANTVSNTSGTDVNSTVVVGISNTATGQRSTIVGNANTASGGANTSHIFGYGNTVTGSSAIAIGNNLSSVPANTLRMGHDVNNYINFTTGGVFTTVLAGTTTSTINGSGITTAGTLVGNGSASAPSMSFSGDTNTGFYRDSLTADEIRISTAGTERGKWTATGTFNMSGSSTASLGSFNQQSAGTAITTPFPAFELVNSNATANNFVTFSFADAVSGASYALIGGKCTDHANNYGELHFWTRGASGSGTRLIIDADGNSAWGTTTSSAIFARFSKSPTQLTTGTAVTQFEGTHTQNADNAIAFAGSTANVALNTAGFNNTVALGSGGGLTGYYGLVQAASTPATGTLTAIIGARMSVRNTGGGIVTEALSFQAMPILNSGAGSITNAYGFYASAFTAATNNYGFYGVLTAATGRWNVYMAGDAQNYMAGNLGLGITVPTETLELKDTGNIKFQTTTGTKIGTATTQKLAFWNATPVVQPTTGITASTFAANTSGIVDDTATFDGYTLGQVVAALRQIGVLA